MQICTSPQTDNHAGTTPLRSLQAGCHSCRRTNSVKALKTQADHTIRAVSSSSPHLAVVLSMRSNYDAAVLTTEPADVPSPRLVRVYDDGTALLRLRPGRHKSITKYFVVVVPDILSRLRDPSDFRLDEVSVSRVSTHLYLSVLNARF